jgi:hypothetical protein
MIELKEKQLEPVEVFPGKNLSTEHKTHIVNCDCWVNCGEPGGMTFWGSSDYHSKKDDKDLVHHLPS